MDRDSVIERIRQGMAAGALPRVIPPLTAPGKPTSPTGHIKFDTSIGIVTCAACDTHGAQVAYRFPDGRILRFHGRCHRIWEDECRRLLPGMPASAAPVAGRPAELFTSAGSQAPPL